VRLQRASDLGRPGGDGWTGELLGVIPASCGHSCACWHAAAIVQGRVLVRSNRLPARQHHVFTVKLSVRKARALIHGQECGQRHSGGSEAVTCTICRRKMHRWWTDTGLHIHCAGRWTRGTRPNSQCRLDAAGCRLVSGNELTLRMNLTFIRISTVESRSSWHTTTEGRASPLEIAWQLDGA